VISFVEAILGESEESGIITHTEVDVEGPIAKIRLTIDEKNVHTGLLKPYHKDPCLYLNQRI